MKEIRIKKHAMMGPHKLSALRNTFFTGTLEEDLIDRKIMEDVKARGKLREEDFEKLLKDWGISEYTAQVETDIYVTARVPVFRVIDVERVPKHGWFRYVPPDKLDERFYNALELVKVKTPDIELERVVHKEDDYVDVDVLGIGYIDILIEEADEPIPIELKNKLSLRYYPDSFFSAVLQLILYMIAFDVRRGILIAYNGGLRTAWLVELVEIPSIIDIMHPERYVRIRRISHEELVRILRGEL